MAKQSLYMKILKGMCFLLPLLLFKISIASELQLDQFGRELIPEIINLSDGEAIPNEVYEIYDSKTIGESIVYRISRTRAKSNYKGISFNAFQQAEIHYYFSLQDMNPNDIVKKGILNIFQAGNNSDNTIVFRQVTHMGIADTLAGIIIRGPENKVNYVRPKYAGLDINFGKELHYETDGLEYFGEIVAVLKPEVLLRTTYTVFDSGAFASHHGSSSQLRARRDVRPLTEAFFFAPRNGSSQYIEAQVWGAVEIKDIQEFLLPPGTSSRTLDKFKKTGVPLYEYVESRENNRYRRLRGKLLSRGVIQCKDFFLNP